MKHPFKQSVRYIVAASSILLLNACDQIQTVADNINSAQAEENTTDTTSATTTTDTTTTTNTQTTSNLSVSQLGEKLYFDENLSNPAGQACASCHLPDAGFADPDKTFPTSKGVITGRFGNRNAPTASYAAHIPNFSFDNRTNQFSGGQFWDGRSSTLEDQAKQPFLNAVEMNNTEQGVVDAVSNSDYADDFKARYGDDIFTDTNTAYEKIAEAIATFERSDQFSPFTSKFDAMQRGLYTFTAQEQRGMNLFNSRNGGDCRRCHDTAGNQQVFSDFSYKNIGIPRNENNPFYSIDATFNPDGSSFTDLGLGGVLNDTRENGKFRVPSLRNIELTAPYMHNGVFNTLEEVVNFYNTRDTNPDQAAPEVAQNVDNGGRIGELGLSQQDISDLVAFLKTLSDGYL